MKGFQKYVYLIPIIQIVATFAVSFVELTENQWVILGNSIGYSVLTGLVYVAYFWNPSFRYCWFTKISAIGLLLMAIYNLIGTFIEYDIYTTQFDRLIFIITIVLIFLLPRNDK